MKATAFLKLGGAVLLLVLIAPGAGASPARCLATATTDVGIAGGAATGESAAVSAWSATGPLVVNPLGFNNAVAGASQRFDQRTIIAASHWVGSSVPGSALAFFDAESQAATYLAADLGSATTQDFGVKSLPSTRPLDALGTLQVPSNCAP